MTALIVMLLLPPGAWGQQPATPGDVPAGVFLWFPRNGVVPTAEDCATLVAEVKPSVKKAEDWLWGRVPEGSSGVLEFYLFVSQDRIDPTWSAEGDYDFGSVTWTAREGNVSRFLLRPDDHPDVELEGLIRRAEDSAVVEYTLLDVPAQNGTAMRTTWFCAFDEAQET
ncbi:MAG: hypothetical protein KF849_16240 [Rhizobiaceae bacterium]|nr:hypothetical protein [Rhizobiaceae bacterium]